MKKWFSFLFVLMMVFAMAAYAEEDSPAVIELSPAKLVGTWYADTASIGSATHLPIGDVRLEINRDQTALLVLNDTQLPFSWNLTAQSTKLTLVPENKQVLSSDLSAVLDASETLIVSDLTNVISPKTGANTRASITFTKDNHTLVLPAAMQAEAEELFYGTYTNAYKVYSKNVNLAEVVPEGTATLRIGFAEAELVSTSRTLYITTFENGVLTLADSQILPEESHRNQTYTLSLTDDDSIIVITEKNESGDILCNYYFKKTVE